MGKIVITTIVIFSLNACSLIADNQDVSTRYTALEIVKQLENNGIECSDPERQESSKFERLRCENGSGELEFLIFENSARRDKQFNEWCGGYWKRYNNSGRYVYGENWFLSNMFRSLATVNEVATALNASNESFNSNC